MIREIIFSLFTMFLVVVFLVLPGSPHAQTNPVVIDHCSKAKNNNDALACMKQHHDQSVARLNELYEQVQGFQSPATLDDFRLSQRGWITYRDQECRWEMSQTNNESLKRVKELECLSRLTNLRSSVLENYLADQEASQLEAFSSTPLWMNVLGNEHPDVFWQNAKRMKADLDCDDVDEFILTGVRIEQSEPVQQEVVIAIAENPITGQPKTDVFKYPVAKELQGAHVCSPNLNISFMHDLEPDQEDEQQAGDTVSKSCSTFIKVESGPCEPILLFWNGTKYTKAATAL